MTPPLSEVALRHYRRAASITRRVTEAMLEAWRLTGPAGFRDELPRMSTLLATGQLAQVLESSQYLEQVAAAQGLGPSASVLRPSGLVGRTAAGADLAEVLELPSIRVSALVTSGVDGKTAADSGAAMLTRIVSNEVTQAGNNATQIGMAGHPGFRGYIRMMKPPSCSRCAVMAGSWWEWNEGFPRHPGCDCIHVPAADQADAMNGKPPWSANLRATDPKSYFESLSKADQDRYFGKTQADAIRGGANVTRTVNANTRAAGLRRFDSGGTPAGPRLTPKQVFEQAGDDRDAAVQLLTDNGYLTPAQAAQRGLPRPAKPRLPEIKPGLEGTVWDGGDLPWGYGLKIGRPTDPVLLRPWTKAERAKRIADKKLEQALNASVKPGTPVKPKPWKDPTDSRPGRPPDAGASLRRRKAGSIDSPEEVADAVLRYTQDGARLVNRRLRTGEYLGDAGEIDRIIRGLARLFDEFPKLTTSRQDMVLYRGISGKDLISRLEPGATIYDAGFTSTSSHVGVARGFATGALPGQNAVLIIRAPAGTRMLNAGRVAADSGGDRGMVELVLNKGTTLRVVSRRTDRSGKYGAPGKDQIVIECEIA
jgi:hypothetical protein